MQRLLQNVGVAVARVKQAKVASRREGTARSKTTGAARASKKPVGSKASAAASTARSATDAKSGKSARTSAIAKSADPAKRGRGAAAPAKPKPVRSAQKDKPAGATSRKRSVTKRASGGDTARKAARSRTAGGKGGRPSVRATRGGATQDTRVVRIRELNAQGKCGPGTSVVHLYRVDETQHGVGVSTHLVFFDRHGWYCEHGRTCPAVDDVRRHAKSQLARIA